ncbi:MAG: hypothetical protein PHN33_06025 [Candidatus Peribacteraceae bacterium]|nr:hypothetical protein [Candidatus Peribacteraceae bacterium]
MATEGTELPSKGTQTPEGAKSKWPIVTAITSKVRNAFAAVMPSQEDLEAIAERMNAQPPWGNTTFSYKLQLKANELEFGQPDTPPQNELDAKREELVRKTVESLPQGDTDAEVLSQAMKQFNKCIAAVQAFAKVYANSNVLMNTERQNLFLRRSFDTLIQAAEETIVNFEKYITPNESTVDSATERKVLQERLQWLEECMTEMQSTSSYKKTIPGTGVPVLPFVFKSLAHNAGHSGYKDKRARQEAVHRLHRVVRDLQHSLIESNTIISYAKRIGEGTSEIITRPIGRVWEYIFSARNSIYKLLVGGAALYGGYHYWTNSPAPTPPPATQTQTPVTTQPTQSVEVEEYEMSAADRQAWIDETQKGLKLEKK